jgi:hypothetical protein
MAEYNVKTPDGASYHIKADTDEQAQSAINDLLGKDAGPQWSDIPHNVMEGIKEAPETLKNIATPWPLKAMGAVESGAMKMALGDKTGGVMDAASPTLPGAVAGMASDYGAGEALHGDIPGALAHAKKTTIEHPISTAVNAASAIVPLAEGAMETGAKYAGRMGENEMGKLHGTSAAQFRQLGREGFGETMRNSYEAGDANLSTGPLGREQAIKERIAQLG